MISRYPRYQRPGCSGQNDCQNLIFGNQNFIPKNFTRFLEDDPPRYPCHWWPVVQIGIIISSKMIFLNPKYIPKKNSTRFLENDSQVPPLSMTWLSRSKADHGLLYCHLMLCAKFQTSKSDELDFIKLKVIQRIKNTLRWVKKKPINANNNNLRPPAVLGTWC